MKYSIIRNLSVLNPTPKAVFLFLQQVSPVLRSLRSSRFRKTGLGVKGRGHLRLRY